MTHTLPLCVEIALTINGESYGTRTAVVQYLDLPNNGLNELIRDLRETVRGELQIALGVGSFRKQTDARE